MKKENKAQIRQFKTAIKNEHLFSRIVLKNPETLEELLRLTETYSPITKESLSTNEFDFQQRFFHRDEIISLGMKTAYSLEFVELGRRSEFFKAIDTIVKRHFLGGEWRDVLITYTMLGILCPPIFNLYIKKEEVRMPPSEQWAKQRVSIILNPDTSIPDIENAWLHIKKIQKSVWPDFKGFNLTKNSSKDLNDQLELIIQKIKPMSDDEQYAAFTDYEARRLKAGHPLKDILAVRRQSGSLRKSAAIKEKRTIADIVRSRGFKQKKAVRKAVNRLVKKKGRMTPF